MSARQVDENGFTLVELLMSVVMSAVIVGAIAAALTTALRNEESTGGRVADSVDTQLLSTYLPGDIQNAGPDAGDLSKEPLASAGCSGLSGTNVLAATWRDAETGASYGVTYRTLKVGEEQRLLRFTCGGATPGASIVARGLAPSGGAVAEFSGNPRIVFTLTSAQGYVSKVFAMRRTYAGGAVAPPPLPCFVDAATLSPPEGRNVSGALVPTVILNAQTSGHCGMVTATYAPDGSTPFVQTLRTGPGSVMTPLTGTGWTAGVRPLTIRSDGTFVADVPFNVVDAPACVVSNVRTSPTAGVRTANPSPNTLASAVRVTADFSDTCVLPYSLEVSTDDGAPKTYAFPVTGPTRFVDIPATVKWSDGSHDLTVKQLLSVAATGTFTVSPQACAVATPVVDPSSVNANGKAKGTGKMLNKSVGVTVTTTGVCDALSVAYTPADTPERKALVPNGTWSTWTYTIGADDHGWTPGTKTLEIVRPTGASLSPVRSRTLEVK